MRTRAEELQTIEAWIAEHDITRLKPFEEGMSRKRWRLTDTPILNGPKRENEENQDC